MRAKRSWYDDGPVTWAEKRKGNEETKIMASGNAVTPNGRYPSVMLLFLFA